MKRYFPQPVRLCDDVVRCHGAHLVTSVAHAASAPSYTGIEEAFSLEGKTARLAGFMPRLRAKFPLSLSFSLSPLSGDERPCTSWSFISQYLACGERERSSISPVL